MAKKRRRLTVEVWYRVDGTTKTDHFRAGLASSTMLRRGQLVLDLVDGRDADGPVRCVQYERAYRVIVRRR